MILSYIPFKKGLADEEELGLSPVGKGNLNFNNFA